MSKEAPESQPQQTAPKPQEALAARQPRQQASEEAARAPEAGPQKAHSGQDKQSQTKQDQSPPDPFLLRKLFPNPQLIITYTSPRISTLVGDCVFVFDSNALLAPFDFGGRELETIAATYRALAANERLFTTEWSLLEFARHRTDKLISAFQTLQNRLSKAPTGECLRSPMLEASKGYAEIQDVLRTINTQREPYRKKLAELLDNLRDWSWDDRVSTLYREVFTPAHIAKCALSDEALLKDTEHRNTYNIPPGYKDKSKATNNVGDLMIWHTLVELSKARHTNVVFVSNEEKHDWVHRAENRVIIAREELYQEFFTKTGAHFGFTNWLGFLELMVKDSEVIRQAERMDLDLSYDYLTVQRQVNYLLERVATIIEEYLSSDHSGEEYARIRDIRLDHLIHDLYKARGRYDDLIHSPTGSQFLAESEMVLEEIESINDRLGYMERTMKHDGSQEEAKLKELCERFLAVFKRYSTWYLAGSP